MYTTVKDKIVQKVQKMYGYEVTCLLRQLNQYNMSKKDKPIRQMSTSTDDVMN